MNETVLIEKCVYGGDGMGRLADGRAIFVPFTLPGEEVLVEIWEDNQNFARGRAVQVRGPSAERVAPPCPHYGACGGCHYQHLPYARQLELKLQILADQLARLGGIPNPPLSGIMPSPECWHYRNQVQFHLDALGQLGYMDLTGKQVVPISQCLLPLADLETLRAQLDLSPEAGLSRVVLRQDSQGEQFIVLEGPDELAPEVSLDLPASVSYLGPDRQAITLAGQDQLVYEVLGKQLSVSPESFFQVNLAVAEQMLSHVLSLLPARDDLRVLELFSGAGFFSAFLADKCRELIAIESSPSACFDFANNLDAYDHVSLYEGEVEQVLPGLVSELKGIDLVVLDPPRAGLRPAARKALQELGAGQIIYISCDPSTLARDLKHLCAAGYSLRDVRAFDMFPQTYHIETVAVLSRAK
ncbi:MAG TPA: class I SAM-dependent RNA methyltransferase [Anaerolineaceae bacterium]|nr:class I SAM-dependent RNA methyltransferase [Anaerolineaceae bacterium]